MKPKKKINIIEDIRVRYFLQSNEVIEQICLQKEVFFPSQSKPLPLDPARESTDFFFLSVKSVNAKDYSTVLS